MPAPAEELNAQLSGRLSSSSVDWSTVSPVSHCSSPALLGAYCESQPYALPARVVELAFDNFGQALDVPLCVAVLCTAVPCTAVPCSHAHLGGQLSSSGATGQ